MRARPAVAVVLAARSGPDPGVSPAQVLLSEPEEAAALYRGLSRQPSLSAACLGLEVTTQYGGRYRTVHTGVCMKGNRVVGPLGRREGGLLDSAHVCVEEDGAWREQGGRVRAPRRGPCTQVGACWDVVGRCSLVPELRVWK